MPEAARRFDHVVLGAGLFGLYAARRLRSLGRRVAVVEADAEPFSRASRINQARVHAGYHYPRSLSTARAAKATYDRFRREFPSAVRDGFVQVYAIAARSSCTSARQFAAFCRAMDLPAREIDPGAYFEPGSVEAAYETVECAFDADAVLSSLLESLRGDGVELLTGRRVRNASASGGAWLLGLSDGSRLEAGAVLNATYAAINDVLQVFGFPPFDLKYEISEVALGRPGPELAHVGITVMDGPFLSVMPFGRTGLHSLTAVDYTPRRTSLDGLPVFPCQGPANGCGPRALANCNACPDRPASAAPFMEQLARKFLRPPYRLRAERSLYAMKAILKASETDDSRPTLVEKFRSAPDFHAVLSGKINTIHDLDKVLL